MSHFYKKKNQTNKPKKNKQKQTRPCYLFFGHEETHPSSKSGLNSEMLFF